MEGKLEEGGRVDIARDKGWVGSGRVRIVWKCGGSGQVTGVGVGAELPSGDYL